MKVQEDKRNEIQRKIEEKREELYTDLEIINQLEEEAFKQRNKYNEKSPLYSQIVNKRKDVKLTIKCLERVLYALRRKQKIVRLKKETNEQTKNILFTIGFKMTIFRIVYYPSTSVNPAEAPK